MGNSDSKDNSYGYRIIKVAPGSPAQKAGLIEFLDYIIDISSPTDTTPFTGNYGEFFKIIQNSEDQEATMRVYNILYRKTRIVTIVPSKKWENADSLLGALVRYEEYATAHERVLRIAEIHPHSPAAIAGLEANTDYILGSPQYLYSDLNELANFIEMTQEKETIKSLELHVFSAQTNSVRSTLIIPNKNWGGSGHLGCEFALGILNHLPQLEDAIPVSTLGENETTNACEQIDRLDESPMSHKEPHILEKGLINEEKKTLGEKVEIASLENKNNKLSKTMPDFRLRPPTSTEVENNKLSYESQKPYYFDLSQELTNQRMKQLHIGPHQKIPGKAVPKYTIRSGKSSANPFHNPEEAASKNGELVLIAPQGHTVEEKGLLAPIQNETHNDGTVKQPNQSGFSQHHHKIQDYSPVHHYEIPNQASHEQNVEKEKHTLNPAVLVPETLELDKKAENVTPSPFRKEPKRAVSHGEAKIENHKKAPQGVKAQERQTYKTTIEYNFFSKKLSGKYKILSSNLFDIEEPLRAKSK